jgi:hypothetical protein
MGCAEIVERPEQCRDGKNDGFLHFLSSFHIPSKIFMDAESIPPPFLPHYPNKGGFKPKANTSLIRGSGAPDLIRGGVFPPEGSTPGPPSPKK